MNNLKIFENEEFGSVRVIEKDGEPWFVGKDVCTVLGLSNPTVTVSKLDDDERTKFNLGRQGEATVVNESGLYSLIIRSRKPEAKKFKRWITHEVIPSIRKHGAYMTPETLEAAILNPDTMIKLCQALKEEQEKVKSLSEANEALNEEVAVLKPKAEYLDIIMSDDRAIPVTKIAKDYGMSAIAFNRLLNDLKIQYRCDGTWCLYQKYADEGYTRTHTYFSPEFDVFMQTKWTQKGRKFLYDLLKENGVLPKIEREVCNAMC